MISYAQRYKWLRGKMGNIQIECNYAERGVKHVTNITFTEKLLPIDPDSFDAAVDKAMDKTKEEEALKVMKKT